MINLISPDKKQDIRAARTNVILVQYGIALFSLGVLIGLIYGLGFWLVSQEKTAVDAKLLSQNEQSAAYAAVEKEAETFRQNLTIAKNILGKETVYSEFLITLASVMPQGTIITNLSLGGPVVATNTGTTLDARTSSYAKVLELKSKLEQSVLFENVSITNASRPDSIADLVGLQARYPYEVSYNVKLSTRPVVREVAP